MLRVGAFIVPLAPMGWLAIRFPFESYLVTGGDFVLLWVIGLAINYAMIAVHELGHAAAAWICDVRVTNITIGHWRRIVSFQIRGTTIDLRAAPDSGYITPQYTAKDLQVGPLSCVLIAGVAAEAAVGCLIAVTAGPGHIESLADIVLEFCRLAVFWTAGAHIFYSLIPNEWVSGGERHVSDGQQLRTLWRSRAKLPEQRQLLDEVTAVNSLAAAGNMSAAREKLRHLTERNPDNLQLLKYLAVLHAEFGDTHEAEKLLQSLLDRPGSEPVVKAELLDALACLALYHNRADLLGQAEGWINLARRYAPLAITLKGTHGGVLVELGRIDDALGVLHEVMARSEETLDHAITAAYLAKAYAAKGDPAEAAKWLAKGKALMPEHVVVKRITRELAEIANRV